MLGIDIDAGAGTITVEPDLDLIPDPIEIVGDSVGQALKNAMDPDTEQEQEGPDGDSPEMNAVSTTPGLDASQSQYAPPGSTQAQIEDYIQQIKEGQLTGNEEVTKAAAGDVATTVQEIESRTDVGQISVGDSSLDALAEAKQAANGRARGAEEELEAAPEANEEIEAEVDRGAAEEIEAEVDLTDMLEIDRGQSPSNGGLGINLGDAIKLDAPEIDAEVDLAGPELDAEPEAELDADREPEEYIEAEVDLRPDADASVEDLLAQPELDLTTLLKETSVDADDPFAGIEAAGTAPSSEIEMTVDLREDVQLEMSPGGEYDVTPMNIELPPVRGAEISHTFEPSDDLRFNPDNGHFEGSGVLTTTFRFGEDAVSCCQESVEDFHGVLKAAEERRKDDEFAYGPAAM